MERIRNRIKECLIVGAIALALAAVLPILGALAFTLRTALLATAAAALVVGLVAYICSSSFREWFKAHSTLRIDYKGLHLATDVALHPTHSWARIDDEVVVGVDDLLQATLGPVEEVELPPEGRRVRRGEPLFRLRRGDRVVAVPAPVSGTVLRRNEALRGRPQLVNEAPFAQGWAVRLKSDDLKEDRRLLLHQKRARAWFHSEVDRVIGLLLPEKTVAPALADGGVLVRQLYRHIDDDAWSRLTETVFAARPNDPEPRT